MRRMRCSCGRLRRLPGSRVWGFGLRQMQWLFGNGGRASGSCEGILSSHLSAISNPARRLYEFLAILIVSFLIFNIWIMESNAVIVTARRWQQCVSYRGEPRRLMTDMQTNLLSEGVTVKAGRSRTPWTDPSALIWHDSPQNIVLLICGIGRFPVWTRFRMKDGGNYEMGISPM